MNIFNSDDPSLYTPRFRFSGRTLRRLPPEKYWGCDYVPVTGPSQVWDLSSRLREPTPEDIHAKVYNVRIFWNSTKSVMNHSWIIVKPWSSKFVVLKICCLFTARFTQPDRIRFFVARIDSESLLNGSVCLEFKIHHMKSTGMTFFRHYWVTPTRCGCLPCSPLSWSPHDATYAQHVSLLFLKDMDWISSFELHSWYCIFRRFLHRFGDDIMSKPSPSINTSLRNF